MSSFKNFFKPNTQMQVKDATKALAAIHKELINNPEYKDKKITINSVAIDDTGKKGLCFCDDKGKIISQVLEMQSDEALNTLIKKLSK